MFTGWDAVKVFIDFPKCWILEAVFFPETPHLTINVDYYFEIPDNYRTTYIYELARKYDVTGPSL